MDGQNVLVIRAIVAAKACQKCQLSCSSFREEKRATDEQSQVSRLWDLDEQVWQDESRIAEVEMPVVWCHVHPSDRHFRQETRRIPGMAAVWREAGRPAGRWEDL